MPTSRRQFLAGSVAALAASGASADSSESDPVDCLDYGRSFICNPAAFNAVRFWVESRTTINDEATGTSMQFLQCGSCKSERTFAEKDLLREDNFDFLPILGDDDWLIFRRLSRVTDRYREVRKADDAWGKPILKLQRPKRVTELDTWEKIRDVTAAAIPIVSKTQLHDASTGLRAVIECPVKSMNISLDLRKYQVDTGPLAFPDLTKRYEKLIDCLSLAFVVFNAPHFADFVVEQPTPIVGQEGEVAQVHHYSNPFSLPAKNRLFAVES